MTPSAQPSVPRILIADDEATTRRLVTFKLEREGFAVASFDNGEELLRDAAKGSPPAVAVLDIMMPVKNGYNTLRQMKKDPALAAVPVIMLSAKNDRADIADCLKAGAADYIVKPFSPAELVDRIRRLLEK